MIGNDIVDLQLAKTQSNWQRPRFIEKIFTKSEQIFIQKSDNPELEIWKLWTRKEAAYKIFNRETGVKGFFPWKLGCSIAEFRQGKYLGTVAIDDKMYLTQTIVTENYVYTIAVKSNELFDRIVQVNPKDKIIKINDLPFIESGIKPVSITHHGRFDRRIALLL